MFWITESTNWAVVPTLRADVSSSLNCRARLLVALIILLVARYCVLKPSKPSLLLLGAGAVPVGRLVNFSLGF